MEGRLGVKVTALSGESVLLVNIITHILQDLAQILTAGHRRCSFFWALRCTTHRHLVSWDTPTARHILQGKEVITHRAVPYVLQARGRQPARWACRRWPPWWCPGWTAGRTASAEWSSPAVQHSAPWFASSQTRRQRLQEKKALELVMRKEILLNSILVLSRSCFGSDLISTISERFACFFKKKRLRLIKNKVIE